MLTEFQKIIDTADLLAAHQDCETAPKAVFASASRGKSQIRPFLCSAPPPMAVKPNHPIQRPDDAIVVTNCHELGC